MHYFERARKRLVSLLRTRARVKSDVPCPSVPAEETARQDAGEESDALSRFKYIIHSISLMGHIAEEMQMVPYVAGQIIASYEGGNHIGFSQFVRSICSEKSNQSDDDRDPHNVILSIVDMIDRGETDQMIVSYVQGIFGIRTEGVSRSRSSNGNVTITTIAVTDHHEKSRTGGSGSALNTLTRKHRAMQYANDIAQGIIEKYNGSDGKMDFLDYAMNFCSSMKTKNSGYVLQMSKAQKEPQKEKGVSHSRPSSGIRVPTDVLTPAPCPSDTMMQDFLYITSAMTTMRLRHDKGNTPADSAVKTSRNYSKDAVGLYEDLVSEEFSPLQKKDKRFDITYRLMAIALNRLKQGWNREQVLDELRRFIVKDNAVLKDCRRAESPQIQKSTTTDKGLVFSAEETKMLRTVRRVVPALGCMDYEVASIIEKRLIRLFLIFSGQFKGKISNYVPLFLQRVNESVEYRIYLEIALLFGRGMSPDAIYKYFCGADPRVAVSSLIKDVAYPDTSAADKSINNNIIFRTWDECIEILTDAFNYDVVETQRLKATILDANLLKKEILQAAFPNRFDSKGHLCKLVKIEEFERDMFKDFEVKQPNVSLFACVPIEKFTMYELSQLFMKAVKNLSQEK